MKRRHLGPAMLAALLAGRGAAAQPRAWPQRPVRLVVALSRRQLADIVARLLVAKLALGQPVVVDNRAGAGGNIGTQLVAKSAPDSHTFLFTTQAPLVAAPSLLRQMPYDPVRELAPVAQVLTAPLLLVAPAQLGLRGAEDLLRLAAARPGALNYGSTGIGQATHLAMELLALRTGARLVHVPYQAAPAMVNAMLSGDLQAGFMVPSIAAPQIEAGRLVPLGVTSATRLPSMPEVPTIAEQGFPGFEVVAWHAVLAPAGTEPEVLRRMAEEVQRAIASEEFQRAMLAQHFAPSRAGPEELAAIIQRETPAWARMFQAAGVQPE